MNHLKESRFFKNVSQYKLALLAGVHQSRTSLIENGLVEPRDDEKKRLTRALSSGVQEFQPEVNKGKANS